MTSDSTVVAQKLVAQQIEYFFDTVMNNLRTQAEGTLQVTQQLATQQRLAQEATRDLVRVSTDSYMDVLDSVFSFYQGGTSRIQRRAEEAQRQVQEAETRAEKAETRAEEATRKRNDAKGQTEEAQRRAEEAEKRVKAAQRRAEEAESGLKSAKGHAEQAEERAEAAERRAEEAERRAEDAQRSGAVSQRGEEEADTSAGPVRHPLSKWVRTSGSSKVRGRNTRSRGRSFTRR